MEIFRNFVDNFFNIIINNRWLILFIVFGILFSYTMGKNYSLKSQTNINKLVIEPEKKMENFIVDKTPNSAIKCNRKNCKNTNCPYITRSPKKNLKKSKKKSSSSDKKKICKKNTYMCLEDVEKNYVSKELVSKNFITIDQCKKKYKNKKPKTIVKEVPKTIVKEVPKTIVKEVPKLVVKEVPKIIVKKEVLNREQEILDNNAIDLNNKYAKIDDSLELCNAKSCNVNGLPNGL